jgi:hypothetical protein
MGLLFAKNVHVVGEPSVAGAQRGHWINIAGHILLSCYTARIVLDTDRLVEYETAMLEIG